MDYWFLLPGKYFVTSFNSFLIKILVMGCRSYSTLKDVGGAFQFFFNQDFGHDRLLETETRDLLCNLFQFFFIKILVMTKTVYVSDYIEAKLSILF